MSKSLEWTAKEKSMEHKKTAKITLNYKENIAWKMQLGDKVTFQRSKGACYFSVCESAKDNQEGGIGFYYLWHG